MEEWNARDGRAATDEAGHVAPLSFNIPFHNTLYESLHSILQFYSNDRD